MGERIWSCCRSLERVEDKGKGATFVTGVRATTPDGEPVVDQFWTIFVRGAGSGTERPPSSATRAEPTRGPAAATFTSHVDAEHAGPLRRGLRGSQSDPLDPDVAGAVGLPGVINHGLGTCSMVTGGLVDELWSTAIRPVAAPRGAIHRHGVPW